MPASTSSALRSSTFRSRTPVRDPTSSVPTLRRRAPPSPPGTVRSRQPAAPRRTQRSWSSPYMKMRSSKPSTLFNASTRKSVAVAPSASTGRGCSGTRSTWSENRAERRRADVLDRSAAGRGRGSAAPRDATARRVDRHCARAHPVDAARMTPCTPAIVGSAKAPTARVTAPMSIVRSGFSTSTNGAVVSRRPLFCPAPNPGFERVADRHRTRRLGDARRAVRAVIDHDDRCRSRWRRRRSAAARGAVPRC